MPVNQPWAGQIGPDCISLVQYFPPDRVQRSIACRELARLYGADGKVSLRATNPWTRLAPDEWQNAAATEKKNFRRAEKQPAAGPAICPDRGSLPDPAAWPFGFPA